MPHIPKKLQKIILKALDKEQSKRYNNTISMMNDLSVIEDNLDWLFTGNKNNPYTKANETHQFDIIIKSNLDIECYRKNLVSGKQNKMNKHCIKCLNEKDLNKNLSKVLGGLN